MTYDRTQATARRGSALVMVVAVVSVVSVLALAFFLTSRLDVKRARAEAERAPVEALAEGALNRVLADRAADRRVHTSNGPYRNLTGSASNQWLEFVDAPDRRSDPYLGSIEPRYDGNAWRWTRVSDFYGAISDGNANNREITFGDLVDTDGGAAPFGGDQYAGDTPLAATGVINVAGQEYHIAVRMVDTSGMLCLNTAGRNDLADDRVAPIHPVNVALRDLLGDALYAGNGVQVGIHRTRYRGDVSKSDFPDITEPTMADFDRKFAQRLYQPDYGMYSDGDPSYRPFAPSSEAYLRWLGEHGSQPRTRLGECLYAMDPNNRQRLTTYAASPAYLRSDLSGLGLDANDDPNALQDLAIDLSTVENRNKLYYRFKAMLTKLDLGSNADPNARKHLAAAFVANLWAYLDDHTGSNDPWPFVEPDANAFAYFGLKQRLVFSEAFALHKPNGDANSDNNYWGHAVEIYNPTDQNISLANYHLYLGGTEYSLNGKFTNNRVDANSRVVVYGFGFGNSASNDKKTPQGIFGLNSIPSNWKVLDSNSDFLLQGAPAPTVRLVRRYTVSGTPVNVPVDEFSPRDDLDYDVADVQSATAKESDMRRDDDLDNARYNVAAYYKRNSGNPNLAVGHSAHKLGQANGLSAISGALTQIASDAKYPVPVLGMRNGQSGLESFGEMGRIYLAGPMITDTNYALVGQTRAFCQTIKDTGRSNSLFGSNAVTRGRLDVRPDNVNYAGYSGSTYPDVPAGALWQEFFTLLPPDTTRQPSGRRFYGKININTAPKTVLKCLLPSNQAGTPPTGRTVNFDGTNLVIHPDVVVEYIEAYRQRRATDPAYINTFVSGFPNKDYGTRSNATDGGAGVPLGAAVTGLRTSAPASQARCFLTPGEIAIPLADYMDALIVHNGATLDDARKHKDYLDVRDAVYRAVANLVTVQSDTYAVTIRVQLGRPAEQIWRYVALIDRGHCTAPADRPAVLLFSQAP